MIVLILAIRNLINLFSSPILRRLFARIAFYGGAVSNFWLISEGQDYNKWWRGSEVDGDIVGLMRSFLWDLKLHRFFFFLLGLGG